MLDVMKVSQFRIWVGWENRVKTLVGEGKKFETWSDLVREGIRRVWAEHDPDRPALDLVKEGMKDETICPPTEETPTETPETPKEATHEKKRKRSKTSGVLPVASGRNGNGVVRTRTTNARGGKPGKANRKKGTTPLVPKV